MGIGTMILFVAMVVAAAVAAVVLIRTAGDLERGARETGSGATSEVSGNILVRDIIGNVTTHQGEDVVGKVRWYVAAAPGADPVDLDSVTLRWAHRENRTDLSRGDGTCEDGLADGFCLLSVHDAGDGDTALLSDGDRVRVEVDLNASRNEELATRAEVLAEFHPDPGAPVDAGFETPATYGNKSNVNLIGSS